MSFQESLKHKFPKQEEKKEKKECDPTTTMHLNKEQCWKFECSVRDLIKSIGESALKRAING